MPADAMYGANDQRDHADLDAEQEGRVWRLIEIQPGVGPGQAEHQQKARQHETGAGDNAPDPPALHHAEMDAQFMRFRTGHDLIDGEQAVETIRAQPLPFIDRDAPDHRDLRNRPAPRQQPEFEEAGEQGAKARSGLIVAVHRAVISPYDLAAREPGEGVASPPRPR